MTVNHNTPLRTVRSFVLRMGRITNAQQRACTDLWPHYGIDCTATPLDLNTQFGRVAPCVLEIGFGTGEALIAYAQAHPEHNCLGIEVHRPGVGQCLLRVQAVGVSHVRVICHDAIAVLQQHLAPASLDAIHIFFPDPWPKKRHHKRRLIQTEQLHLFARALKVGGIVHLATDWQDYAIQMQAVFTQHPLFVGLGDRGQVKRSVERPLTRFERRGQRLGHGVWDLAYQRVADGCCTG